MIGTSTNDYVTGVGSLTGGAKFGASLHSFSESKTIGSEGKAKRESPSFPFLLPFLHNVQPFLLLESP